MTNIIKAAAIITTMFAAPTLAIAQDKDKAHELTVGDVINVYSALSSGTLDVHQTGVVDKNGNPVTAPNDFNFSGTVHLAMARDAAQGLVVFQAYQKAVTALRIQVAGIGKDVPKEKLDDFNMETSKMLEAPAGVTLVRIKEADLCLDIALPACPTKNNIPVSTLSLLWPIIDQSK